MGINKDYEEYNRKTVNYDNKKSNFPYQKNQSADKLTYAKTDYEKLKPYIEVFSILVTNSDSGDFDSLSEKAVEIVNRFKIEAGFYKKKDG